MGCALGPSGVTALGYAAAIGFRGRSVDPAGGLLRHGLAVPPCVGALVLGHQTSSLNRWPSQRWERLKAFGPRADPNYES